MRLIDADALLEKMQFRLPIDNHDAEVIDGCVKITRRIIEAAPTIDAVPVVRCKGCKYYHESVAWCDKHSSFVDEKDEPCHPWESSEWKTFELDDFCSYGEWRESNE